MNKTLLLIIPLLEVILVRFKFIEICIKPLNTLIHELSHALVALILGNKVKEIKINTDYSGSCTTAGKSKVKQFFISIAGYTLPAILGFLIIKFLGGEHQIYFFYTLIFINIIALILYIRNSFGIIWTIVFILLNFCFIYFPFFTEYHEYILYTYSCILLLENIISTLILVKINFSNSKKAGDSTILEKTTHIPAIIYSLAFFAFSIWLTYKAYTIILFRYFQ